MKIQKVNNKKSIVAIVVAAIIAVLALGTYITYAIILPATDKMQAQNTQQQETDAGNQAKKDTVNSTSNPETPADKGEQTPTPQGENIPISITASSQTDSIYQIRTMISALVTTGTCQLQMTKGNTTVNKSAGVSAFAQTSTCQGFDIPLSELSAGTWNVKITFEGSGKTGSVSSDIEVK